MAIVLIRTIIIYLTLLITMRMLGKRQLGEMELSEFVVAALSADLAAHPLQDIGIPLLNGIVPVLTLFCFEVLIAFLSMRSIKFRSLLFGRPSLIIQHGKILQREMQSNRFTADELMQELRSQGYYDISRVQYAVLETNGTLSIMPCHDDKSVTAGMLGVAPETGDYPSIIINKGRILDNNLSWLGFDRQWLENILKAENAPTPENIYLMLADRQGKIYISEKEELN